MGFQATTYRLVWPEGHQFHGLEVSLRGMSIGELEAIATLQGEASRDLSNLQKLTPLLDTLGAALLDWNYEDRDGVPIPVKDFREQDSRMLLAIIAAWTEVVGDVPAPLPKDSSAGEKFLVESMPMEIPSASHPSLSMQS